MKFSGEPGNHFRRGLASLVLGQSPRQPSFFDPETAFGDSGIGLSAKAALLRLLIAAALLAMAVGVVALVYLTGGIKFVFSHTMYLVILLGGFCFGIVGGAVTGMVTGLLLGPYMPIDVANGEMQAVHNWVYRMLMFMVAGSLAGFFRHLSLKYIQQINWIRSHDSSTELPNKVFLHSVLRHRLRDSERTAPWAMVVLYINNIDDIEYAYGADSANRLVRQLADAISATLDNRQAFRVSMHQLVYLLDARGRKELMPLLRDIQQRLQEPFRYDAFSTFVDVRIGYTFLEPSRDSPRRVLLRALSEVRMAIRNDQKRIFPFTSGREREAVVKDNLELLKDFKAALTTDQLLLFYQPKIELASGRITGAEALVRWQHPERGFISPGAFIPLVENSSLINDLTDWILDEVIRQQRQWERQGITLTLAANISATDLTQPGFAESVVEKLDRAGVRPGALELEVTESAVMDSFELATATLAELSAGGVRIAIDDFGTGHSSLKYLSRLPADIIKIDQSFVRDLNRGLDAEHIVHTVIDLSHRLNKNTVAEGIEDTHALQFLQRQGCLYGQGYFISRPLARQDFTDWFHSHKGHFPVATETSS